MPSTSRASSTEPPTFADRIRTIVCGILLTVLAVFGCWRAYAGEAPRTHTVTIAAMKYTPATLHVQPGDRIVFKNDDFLPHTATAKPAGAFDSGMIKSGETWTLTAPAGGTLHYACTFHPTMEGNIVVETK